MEDLVIEHVRKRSYLYDHNSPLYRDKPMRIAAWEEIGREINMRGRAVQNVWEKLRRCLSNALNRRKRMLESGAKPLPPWKYEQDMAFLLPHIYWKKSRRDPDDDEMHDYDDSTFDDYQDTKMRDCDPLVDEPFVKNEMSASQTELDVPEQSSSNNKVRQEQLPEPPQLPPQLPPQQPAAIKRKRSPERKLFKPPERQRPSSLTYCDLDESDMFFLSMAKTTKTLGPVEQAKVKLMISQAVFQAQIAQAEQSARTVTTKRPDSAASTASDYL
ncbi:uncharacterized protein LOC131682370 [Topomyia yanbarensis]|uniref:uncharacterized protein LOC131682370 n=1 Tax=Topomyia yanbarensis TaxID=2498891 RepID=UPI00273B298A|nr:uncharacterized protein LOC131682370 [Topomyia yanbarensis]